MVDEEIRYDRMVETALRGVVKDALTQASKDGLPGEHHFYITFKTGHPGVRIPGYLRAQYTDEMTIVLQYQYLHLEVDEVGFSVSLSFNNKHEHLRIPFAAVTTFADPSVNFALQFQALSDEDMTEEGAAEDMGDDRRADKSAPSAEAGSGSVTSLKALDTGETKSAAGRKKGRKPDTAKSGESTSENAPKSENTGASSPVPAQPDETQPAPDAKKTDETPDDDPPEESKVVTLDKFRKK